MFRVLVLVAAVALTFAWEPAVSHHDQVRRDVRNRAAARFVLCPSGEVIKYRGNKAMSRVQQMLMCEGQADQAQEDRSSGASTAELTAKVARGHALLALSLKRRSRELSWLAEARGVLDARISRLRARAKRTATARDKLLTELAVLKKDEQQGGRKKRDLPCETKRQVLELQLADAESFLEELSNSIKEAELKRSEVSKRLAALTQENAELDKKAKDLRATTSDTVSRLSEAMEDVEELGDAVRDCRADKRRTAAQAGAAKAKLKDEIADKSQLSDELAGSKSALEDLKKRAEQAAAAQDALRQCEARRGELQRGLDDTERENEKLAEAIKNKPPSHQQVLDDFVKNHPNQKLVPLGSGNNRKLYFFSDGIHETQPGSVNRCRSLGMTLTFLNTAEKNNLVKQHILSWNYPLKRYWTSGVRKWGNNFVWKTKDGSEIPVSFSNWHRGEPNNFRNTGENCIEIESFFTDSTRNGQFGWNDIVCHQHFNYVCEYP